MHGDVRKGGGHTCPLLSCAASHVGSVLLRERCFILYNPAPNCSHPSQQPGPSRRVEIARPGQEFTQCRRDTAAVGDKQRCAPRFCAAEAHIACEQPRRAANYMIQRCQEEKAACWKKITLRILELDSHEELVHSVAASCSCSLRLGLDCSKSPKSYGGRSGVWTCSSGLGALLDLLCSRSSYAACSERYSV
jgi:hypothetical protein